MEPVDTGLPLLVGREKSGTLKRRSTLFTVCPFILGVHTFQLFILPHN